MKRYIILPLLLAALAFATQSDDQADRVKRVRAEVERRKQIREQKAAEEANARRVVRGHESGVKKATNEQLATAKEVIRKADERRAAFKGPLKTNQGADLRMPD